MTPPIPPVLMVYDGDGQFHAAGRWAQLADKHYVIGQTYFLVEHHERSAASHSHLFAEVQEVWNQLPERMHEAFPNPEALRKHVLCLVGACDVETHVCASNAEALRLRGIFSRRCDLVTVSGRVVTMKWAHSQAYRAMDKRQFQETKDKMLGVLAGMIGVSPETLSREAGKAA